jgi:hypothetical protein
MVKRGEASPDDADALALTFARPVALELEEARPIVQPFSWAGEYAPFG